MAHELLAGDVGHVYARPLLDLRIVMELVAVNLLHELALGVQHLQLALVILV